MRVVYGRVTHTDMDMDIQITIPTNRGPTAPKKSKDEFVGCIECGRVVYARTFDEKYVELVALTTKGKPRKPGASCVLVSTGRWLGLSINGSGT